MNRKFLALLRKKFAEGLATKTGWGRVEIQSLFDRCAAEAAVEALDQDPNP